MSTTAAVSTPADLAAGRGESRRRILAGVLLLYFGVQGSVGLAWDIFWHVAVGRDRFLTPPHVFMYTAVAAAGLISLYMVLTSTWRYRRGVAGVNDGTTTPWLRLFHAPVGFVIAGLGCLTLLCAAPLDNYWHILYGIDVDLWTPFHIMGLVGGLIVSIGIMYLFASEANRARRRGDTARRLLGMTGPEWGFCLAVTNIFDQTFTVALPALSQHLLLSSDPAVALHPLLLAVGLPLAFGILVRQVGRTEAAVVGAALYALINLASEGFARLGTAWLVAAEGYSYRPTAPPLGINPLPDQQVVVGAVMFWLAYRYFIAVPTRRARRAAPWVAGLMAAAGIALADRQWLAVATTRLENAGNVLMISAILAALVGALLAACGDGAGRVLRQTER